MGLKIHLSKSCFLASFFIEISKNQKIQTSELLKNSWFSNHIHLTLSQQYKLRKTIKTREKGGMTQ